MPERIYRPADEEQIAGLIRQAAEDRKLVKAIGGALSWLDIIDLPQNAMIFSEMDNVLHVDRDNRKMQSISFG